MYAIFSYWNVQSLTPVSFKQIGCNLLIQRCGLFVLIMIQLWGWHGQYKHGQIIQTCSEAAFDTALTTAKDGDAITFTCDEPITLTNPKVITQSLSIKGRQHRIISTYQGKKPLITIAKGHSVAIDGMIFASEQRISGWLHNEGLLTITTSIFRESSTAIYNAQGSVLIQNSLIENNLHGIANYGGNISVSSVVFRNNEGTAVYNSKSAAILDSTFIAHLLEIGMV
jgi:hypothetical protein